MSSSEPRSVPPPVFVGEEEVADDELDDDDAPPVKRFDRDRVKEVDRIILFTVSVLGTVVVVFVMLEIGGTEDVNDEEGDETTDT